MSGLEPRGRRVFINNETGAITNENRLPVDLAEGFNIPEFDTIELGYTGDDLTSVEYKKDGTTVTTLTLSYTAGKLTEVSKS